MKASRLWGALLVAIVLAGCIVALTADRTFFSTLFSDDSYYYFLTAHNITHGEGVTFDGINTTNGFHPLWMVTLLPIFGLLDADPITPLRAVLILQVLLFVASAVLTRRLLARRFGELASWVGTAALLLPPIFNFFFSGLETGLVLAAMLLFLERAEAGDWLSLDSGPAVDLRCGAALALISLCRLDMAFLAVGVNLAFLGLAAGQGKDSFRRALLKALRITAIYMVVIAPYLIWNQIQFGHLMPISSVLKTAFPALATDFGRLLNPQRLIYLAFAVGAVVLALGGLILGSRIARDELLPERNGRRRAGLALALTLATALHALNTVLFMDWAVYWWHFVGYVPLILFWVTFLGRAIERKLPGSATRVALVLIVALGGIGMKTVELNFAKSSFHDNWLAVAEWTRVNTPEDMVFGMKDCGLFAWYSQRRVVNLDGVINNITLQEAIHEGRLPQYLQDCGVDVIAAHNVAYREGQYRFYVHSRLYPDDRIFALEFYESDEIHRTEPQVWISSFRGKAPQRRFIIWRLPEEDLEARVIER